MIGERELTRLFASAFPEAAPGPELWEVTQRSMRRRVRSRRVAALTLAAVVAVGLAVVPAVLTALRGPWQIEFFEPAPQPETPELPAPVYTEKPLYPAPSPSPSSGPSTSPSPSAEEPASATPSREPEVTPNPGAEEIAPAGPARVEIRNYRLVLLDADGRVVRELYGDYDPAVHGPEYGMRDVALRPGSTTRDLAVTVVDGSNDASFLRLVVVRDGGEPQVSTVATIDYEVSGYSAAAELAAAWSPDGAFLAWLEPDAADRAVLRGLRWSGGAPAGDATPPGGAPVDPAGVAQADGAAGLRVTGWRADPDQLAVEGYKPANGERLSYALPLTRADGQLRPGQLGRAQ